MDGGKKLTKREKKELRKLEWSEKAQKEQRDATVKKYSIWIGAILAVLLTVGGLIWLVTSPSSSSSSVNVAAISTSDIAEGNKDAKVKLIEYADFQCPACAAYHPIVNQLLNEFKGKIYYAYRMFPLENIHKNALISAQAGYAAFKQGKFFDMDDLLYNGQNDWSEVNDPRSIFLGYARKINLDIKKFEADMDSGEAKDFVKKSEDQAIAEGLNSTPTFILNGSKIQNPQTYDDFKKIINDELNKK